MKRTACFVAAIAALWLPASASAQTVINNTIINNNSNGNGYGGNVDTGQAVYWRNDTRHLETWLYTDRTSYRPGTGVQLRLTLTNLANNTQILQAPRTGEYTIRITDVRTNRVVWTRDRSRSGGTSLQLNGGGMGTWTEFWDQRDNAGNVVPMGAYRIDVRMWELLPVSAQIFLTDRATDRPQTGGAGPQPDPVDGMNGNDGNRRPRGGTSMPQNSPVLNNDSLVSGSLTLTKNKAMPGDAVKFIYTVTNNNQVPVTLIFNSTQMFDVWATLATRTPTARTTPVWRLGEGVAWAQILQPVTLQPGEQKVFQGAWRIGSDLVPGQTLNVNASLTPAQQPYGTVGAARTQLTIGQ